MTLFLDAEYNGFGGDLISIALVSNDGTGRNAFYEVRELPEHPVPWVKHNVIPVLRKKPIADPVLQKRLVDFLTRHPGQDIIADWPEDFIHLLKLLGTIPGWAYRLNLTMRLVKTDELNSETPHNALSDAKALMEWWAKR